MLYSLFVSTLIIFFSLLCNANDRKPATDSQDGFFHVALFGQVSPGSRLIFPSYTAGPAITSANAQFGTGSFTSAGVEFLIFTSQTSGFSLGYSTDSARNIDYKLITYSNGSSTRTIYSPRDSMQNSSFLFNWYASRTPDRGYSLIGLNYSNPRWSQSTVTNSQITLSGGIGIQGSLGSPLAKGIILDLTFRTTNVNMKSADSVAATYEDFGRGSVEDLLLGLKFIF